jgi:Flp pilus assembly protein TadG
MAVAMPLLVTLLLITIDVARLFYTHEAMTSAVHAAALYAARNPNPSISDLTTLVTREGVLLDPSRTTVTSSGEVPGSPVSTVTVTLGYDFSLMVPGFTAASIHLTARAVESVQSR